MYTVGLDEVGRGALAGPLIAGCVAIDHRLPRPKSIIITDSKKMTPQQRAKSAEWILANALAWGIGSVSPRVIDHLGVTKASHIAFRQAVSKVQAKINIAELFIDAFYVPRVKGVPQAKQRAIVRGDATIFAISAASIIAKVLRDELMTKLSANYEAYLWHKNKGYGTADHRDAIREYGPCRHHRELFIRNLV